jgi:hypothetical protein
MPPPGRAAHRLSQQKWRSPVSLDATVERLLSDDVRAACVRRRTAQGAFGAGRRVLSTKIVGDLVQSIIQAANYAALGPVPNKIARRGAPPNNARIILAHDVSRALTDLDLSDGLHYDLPDQSLAVELYIIVATHVWGNPQGNLFNPRSTFERMKTAKIIQN